MRLDDLAASAQNLLDQFAIELGNAGVAVPPAQYVASGIIPWDGESLTVNLVEINQGQPGAPIGTSNVVAIATVMYVVWNIQILREAPALTSEGFAQDMTPSPETLGEAGLEAVGDAQGLTQAAIAIHAAYSASGPGESFVIGPVHPLGPEGGISGMTLQLGMSLA